MARNLCKHLISAIACSSVYLAPGQTEHPVGSLGYLSNIWSTSVHFYICFGAGMRVEAASPASISIHDITALFSFQDRS